MPLPLPFPALLGTGNGRSPLVRRPGTLSGRAVPTGWAPPEGTHAVVLGSDEPGYTALLATGDLVAISQTNTFVGSPVLVVHSHVRAPTVIPVGCSWVAYIAINGAQIASYNILPGVDFDLSDFAVNLTDYVGQTVTIDIGLQFGSGSVDLIEAEIPALYVDDVVFDTTSGLLVTNRVPAAGLVGWPFDANYFSFAVMSTAGVLTTASLSAVYVNGALVVTDGVITDPAWFGYVNTNGTRTVVTALAPSVQFASQELVTVRVVATDGAATVDETWSFTIQDVTAPSVAAAFAPAHNRIRVSFDERVKQLDAAATNDALNPANYAVVATTVPAVSVRVVSVEPATPSDVDLVLDITMTPGATYVVTVQRVVDVLGNVLDPLHNTASTTGFECAKPANRRFALWGMLSDNDRERDESGDLQMFLDILQEPLDLLLCDVDAWTDILDVDLAEERYVDQILIGLGNPFTRFDLGLDDKRRLARVLVSMYAQKGTAVGIVNVIRFFLGLELTVTTYNDEGWVLGVDELGYTTSLAASTSWARYAFEVTSSTVLTDEQRSQIRQIVDYMKPAHTHLVRIVEPTPPVVIDHVELGLSQLDGNEWILH